jgi:hypothetical protein
MGGKRMNTVLASRSDEKLTLPTKRAAQGNTPEILADIYQDNTNIAIWQRDLSEQLTSAVDIFFERYKTAAKVLTVTPENTFDVLCDVFGDEDDTKALKEDIVLLVDMFCCLFELKHAGLRITILDRAMCPRFHVDKIPCRLVTTYQGIATDWLHHDVINREKLGAGNQGESDEKSGLFKNISDINQLTQGDVALLKGEYWYKNEGAGLVHRSPPVAVGENRLLLTLDFINE